MVFPSSILGSELVVQAVLGTRMCNKSNVPRIASCLKISLGSWWLRNEWRFLDIKGTISWVGRCDYYLLSVFFNANKRV